MTIQDFTKTGVVAAVTDDAAFEAALSSSGGVIFLLSSDIFTAAEKVRRAHAADKKILVHIDLMDGIGRDETAIKYIASVIGADGVITTRPALIKCAKAHSLFTVLRAFIIDSQGLESAITTVKKLSPDAVEIMPGLMPQLINRFDGTPVIIGGLISSREEVDAGLRSGAIAASTSQTELWG